MWFPFPLHFVLPKSLFAFSLETSCIGRIFLVKYISKANIEKKMINDQNISLFWKKKYEKELNLEITDNITPNWKKERRWRLWKKKKEDKIMNVRLNLDIIISQWSWWRHILREVRNNSVNSGWVWFHLNFRNFKKKKKFTWRFQESKKVLNLKFFILLILNLKF